jgi:HEPN domain-containing protein
MLSTLKRKQFIEYWQENAKQKVEVMEALYKSKKYSDCLFFGHLALECILKAFVVKDTKETAPKIHNLARLEEMTELNLSSEEIKFLAQVNEFNMEARYPDVKFAFYKMCDKKFTDGYYKGIQSFYKKLCQNLKQN